MLYLLDINILIARLDAAHEHHKRVTQWWHGCKMSGWATCPITENGFIRILGRPSYPGWPGTVERAAKALSKLITAFPGHRFISDDVTLLDATHRSLLTKSHSTQITELYLLSLAVKHRARFATLDARIKYDCVEGGKLAYEVIDCAHN